MATLTDEMSVGLECHVCGYDLRAHPPEGRCPECGEAVAESRRVGAIPRRPAWRESDPRWRRRMVAGAWVLVLLPLMDVLKAFGWAWSITVPTVFDFRGALTLDETFLSDFGVYKTLLFCIGIVLLFSKERGRRAARLDWTRRWGVLCSYVVLLLSAAHILFIVALVLAGISAQFLSMPAQDQPGVTPLFVNMSWVYLRYGPYPGDLSYPVRVAFSSAAILLACVPLFDALRSSGPKRLAAVLLAPLASLSLLHLAQAGRYCLESARGGDFSYSYGVYFAPDLLAGPLARVALGLNVAGSELGFFILEAVKWCIVLGIAVWLSIAQLAAWRRGGKGRAA
jgi:hypothetical protein